MHQIGRERRENKRNGAMKSGAEEDKTPRQRAEGD